MLLNLGCIRSMEQLAQVQVEILRLLQLPRTLELTMLLRITLLLTLFFRGVLPHRVLRNAFKAASIQAVNLAASHTSHLR